MALRIRAAGLVAMLLLPAAATSARLPIDGTFLDPRVMEITSRHDPAIQPSGPLATAGGHQVGDRVSFWAQDFSDDPVYGTFYLLSATCRHVGERTYVFVEDYVWNTSFDQEDVDALALALEQSTPADSGGIVGVDEATFGAIPDEIDGDPRVYFLVLDIRDPVQSNLTILGYFSPYNQFTDYEARFIYGGHSNEVEMLYIDCDPADLDDAIYVSAHELVHLIQWGIRPFSGEELWVIENQAQSGPFVCGYKVEQVATFLEVGGVSPLGWTSYEDDYRYVAGYGAGYLFFAYIYENYGGSRFLWNSLHSGERGLEGLQRSIESAIGGSVDLDSILEDWLVANWVDDPDVCGGLYGYESFRIADFDPMGQGGRRGLDYSLLVDSLPAIHRQHEILPRTGDYYGLLPSTGEGSLRASAEGLGELSAYRVSRGPDGSVAVERLQTGTGMQLAAAMPDSCDMLLFANSDFGLMLEVAADDALQAGSDDQILVYPNPSLGSVFFEFESNGGPVQLALFDLEGSHVHTVDFGTVQAGQALLEYSGAESLSTGVYFFRLTQGNAAGTGKIALVR
ncbi:T9SS type A sorting domain-containing protein [Candidatus Fermentibacterales bacterium]|nr:T9SS type A sorting domain-containing protein [Candidatus Fermentibacterales bacterium]